MFSHWTSRHVSYNAASTTRVIIQKNMAQIIYFLFLKMLFNANVSIDNWARNRAFCNQLDFILDGKTVPIFFIGFVLSYQLSVFATRLSSDDSMCNYLVRLLSSIIADDSRTLIEMTLEIFCAAKWKIAHHKSRSSGEDFSGNSSTCISSSDMTRRRMIKNCFALNIPISIFVFYFFSNKRKMCTWW